MPEGYPALMALDSTTPASGPTRSAEIHQVVVGPMDNNVYVLRCTQTGDGVLIDAANEHDQLLELARALGVRKVLETHGHWDHIQAVTQMRDAGYSVGVTQADADMLPSYDEILDDDTVVPVGRLRLRTIHTPGHTPGSMCFAIEGKPVLFSGDTLFPGGPGQHQLRGRRFPHHHHLAGGAAVSPVRRGHAGAAGTRRSHHRRRRGAAPGRVGGTWLVASRRCPPTSAPSTPPPCTPTPCRPPRSATATSPPAPGSRRRRPSCTAAPTCREPRRRCTSAASAAGCCGAPGPPTTADARYVAVDAGDLEVAYSYRLFPDGSGTGTGPSGATHDRFRSWKEDLRDHDGASHRLSTVQQGEIE